MEDQQTSSKSKLVSGQKFMNSFLLPKDEASRELVLREAYDRPRHLQALLALCARRRLPLNAIEWPELHNLLLSANPEISDLAQFSRRKFIRALILNYERYRQILQNNSRKLLGISIYEQICGHVQFERHTSASVLGGSPMITSSNMGC
jgi:hypothetical protein